MLKNVKLSFASDIFNFPRTDQLKSPDEEYLVKVNELMDKVELDGWRLRVLLNFARSDWLGVFKRTRRYPSTKEIDLTIRIPVPTKNDCEYGLAPKMFVRVPVADEKKYRIEKVNFNDFNNMIDLFDFCIRRGLEFVVEDGFRINGVLVKG